MTTSARVPTPGMQEARDAGCLCEWCTVYEGAPSAGFWMAEFCPLHRDSAPAPGAPTESGEFRDCQPHRFSEPAQ